MTFKTTSLTVILTWFGFLILAAAGYVMNVVELITMGYNAEQAGEFIGRIAGVFIPPLGAILGWFM
jgi:hypothetical protein